MQRKLSTLEMHNNTHFYADRHTIFSPEPPRREQTKKPQVIIMPCKCFYKLYDIERPETFVVSSVVKKSNRIKLALLQRGLRNRQIGYEIDELLVTSRKILLDSGKEEDYRRGDFRIDNHDCDRALNLIYYIKTDLMRADQTRTQRVESEGSALQIRGRDSKTDPDEDSSDGSESSGDSAQNITIDLTETQNLTVTSQVGASESTVDVHESGFCEGTGESQREIFEEQDDSLLDQKLDGYYRIKSILDCRVEDEDKRYFLVGWFGQEDTWEPEQHLDGCIDLLRAFLEKNPQFGKDTHIQPLLGVDNRRAPKIDERNLVSASLLMKTIASFSATKTYQAGLDVKLLTASLEQTNLNQDGIYIYLNMRHCFVILFRSKEKLALVADGANISLKDPQLEKTITEFLGDVEIKRLEFPYQSGVDHCATSAVSITLEFMRLYKDRAFLDEHGWPKKLQVPTRTQKRIAKRFHKHPSAKMYSREANLARRVFPRCQICGRAFQTTNRSSVTIHELSCRKKRNNLAQDEATPVR